MAQANYKQAVTAMSNLKPFKGNTLWGETVAGAYYIHSYNTIMARVAVINGTPTVTYLNTRKYSVTTSKHQNYILQALGGMPVAEGAIA